MSKKNNQRKKNKRIVAGPDCVQEKLRELRPGDCLVLKPGKYCHPLTVVGIRGDAQKKIVIRGTTPADRWWEEKGAKRRKQRLPNASKDAVITSDVCAEKFRKPANRAAALKQAAGGFPGLYYIADEARLYLRDCQHVVIENLYFDECWPTAIYLDNCQDIDIKSCQFRWGTFAIGATGAHTRHLLIEDCRWQQNPENDGHWKAIPWHRIHGDTSNYDLEPDKGVVNVNCDHRHFDGDFFSGWRIAGFVTFRRNLIEDAFNGIHLFNEKENVSDLLNLNVVIEHNRFERIRDNAIEPEYGAWNWVIRHNTLIDVYRWFSFDMERSGWFYIYDNLAWYTQEPGPGDNPKGDVEKDARTGGSVFKLPKRHKADGPTYMFHNSFHLRERILKKKRFAGLKFFNNAIAFCKEPAGMCSQQGSLFASGFAELAEPYHPGDDEDVILAGEKSRFTKHWRALDIAFHHNIIDGPDRVKDLIMLGYPFGECSKDGVPNFKGPFSAKDVSCASFHLKKDLKHTCDARNAATEFTLQTRGPQKIKVKAGMNIGAYQSGNKRFSLPEEFKWIGSWSE